MSEDPFIGEIQMIAGTFAARGWALCDGRLLNVSDNDELFSLLGTTYGGDGRTTFGLPDLRGRVPLGQGQGPGLSDRRLGSSAGEEEVTLTADDWPLHRLACQTTSCPTAGSPVVPGTTAVGSSVSLDALKGGQSHPNTQPFLVINYAIALVGTYPSRY